MRLAMALTGAALLSLFASACSSSHGPPSNIVHDPRKGVYHELAHGETLWQLSQRYGVPIDTILRANRTVDPLKLSPGMRIFIPGAETVLTEDKHSPDNFPLVRGCSPAGELKQERQAEAKREADVAFEWPVRGRITTCFAPENGRVHDGIDISVPEGTPVHAAEAGEVVYSAPLGAYGNLVVVRHAGPYTSLYAHNEKNLAEPGTFVSKGDVIAEAGTTGNATGPHLHFEIRRDRRPDNPFLYLP